jgi:phosphosulfolactate phosphohydrolase-like enzyme
MGELEQVVAQSGSGRELCAIGFAEDVRHAARLDVYDAVPVLRGERLERLLTEQEHAR